VALVHIGERIVELREAQLLRQSELAKRAGISPSTLSQIESGRVSHPHIGTLRKVARALDIEPAELMAPVVVALEA
jgi:transcriptional regulator with XRE-family HTH domain